MHVTRDEISLCRRRYSQRMVLSVRGFQVRL